MTDCSSIHGSSTSSSDLNSHHGAMSKIRTVRLIRPHTGNRNNLTLGHPPFSSYGFSLRGGREFGTGFFVSNVVKGSEADLKGLQVGDQIIRVGGSTGSYRVDDAVHKELSQFIINQDRLTLKVRGESSGDDFHETFQLFIVLITSLKYVAMLLFRFKYISTRSFRCQASKLMTNERGARERHKKSVTVSVLFVSLLLFINRSRTLQ